MIKDVVASTIKSFISNVLLWRNYGSHTRRMSVYASVVNLVSSRITFRNKRFNYVIGGGGLRCIQRNH